MPAALPYANALAAELCSAKLPVDQAINVDIEDVVQCSRG